MSKEEFLEKLTDILNDNTSPTEVKLHTLIQILYDSSGGNDSGSEAEVSEASEIPGEQGQPSDPSTEGQAQ